MPKLSSFQCPNCGSSNLKKTAEHIFKCTHCGSVSKETTEDGQQIIQVVSLEDAKTLLTDTPPVKTPDKKRGMPLWIQITVWTIMIALLVVVFIGLKNAREGNVQAGAETGGFDFTMPLFEGYYYEGAQEVSLTDLRGKIVVLNFWASWCTTCKDEAVELEEAWQNYRSDGDVVFIGVDYVDTEPEARGYLEKYEITYPNGPDMGTQISQAFRIQGVPETYFLDRDGVVQYVQLGPFRSTDQIMSVIESLLAK